MLRLSTPGNSRFVQSDSFDVVYGGGEANVAVSLAAYGHDAYFVTKLPRHEIGQSAVNALRRYGVKSDFIARGGDRVDIYYLETGASMRPSKVIYDRAHSSISEADPCDFDFDAIMEGADWFHWSGITPAISDKAAELTRLACEAAKRHGVNVTCETAPHYLVLDDSHLAEDGRFKMNPPLRAAADREALLEGLLDGTVDMIATDHAPHSAEEKGRGLAASAFGIVGLETAFPVLYTKLVREGILSLDKLIDLLSLAPRRRFGLPLHAGDFSVWALDAPITVEPDKFLTKGRATPFAGWQLFGKCVLTAHRGTVVYENN